MSKFAQTDTRTTSPPLNLVAISGSVRTPSRTAALVRAIADPIAQNARVSTVFLTMAEIGPAVMAALTADALTPEALGYIRQVESADILVIGSPIYRASYTGVLKHLFDMVDYRALAGAVGVIAATGGTALHALATEHQFRPLFGFFRIIGVPTTVYALASDFDGAVLASEPVRERIAQAAADVTAFLPLAARRQAARINAGNLAAA